MSQAETAADQPAVECRDWLPPEIGTIAWFSFDNPGQSPRIPIFAGTLSLPPSFEICGQHRYREDSACWWFRRANRLAMSKWWELGNQFFTMFARGW